jgi:hypothetical protein
MIGRPLTKAEVAAMWLLGDAYSKQRRSAIDFYHHLHPSHKRMVADFLAQIERAPSSVPSSVVLAGDPASGTRADSWSTPNASAGSTYPAALSSKEREP